MKIDIRLETAADYRAVEELTREAFWNHHVPGCDEHYLAHILRDADAFIPALDFVAVVNSEIVGNIMYSKGWVEKEDGTRHDVILFGPLSVLPAMQGKGVGGALVRHSFAVAREMGYGAVFIYGDPQYYARHGFRPASDFGVLTADGKTHPALQGIELIPGAMDGIHGRFHEDPIYETIQETDAQAYDAGFPPKEKVSGTPSQQRFAQLSGGGEG